MYKYEYKCPSCNRIYKSNQNPQHIFICDCGRVDIPLYSINIRCCKPVEIEMILNYKSSKLRYKWITKDGRELYIDEISKTHKENIIKMLNRSCKCIN